MTSLGLIEYTARDYTTIREQLLARIVARFPDFDVSAASPDIVLLEALAELGDRLSYLENRSVNEAFLTRAVLRKSVIDHCKLIDYQLSTAQPARVQLRFRLVRAYPDASVIPARAVVETDDGGVSFETDEELTIQPGLTEGFVWATEGKTVVDAAVGVSAIEAPEGQRVTLSTERFISASDVVTVAGATWTRVDTFLNSDSFARHYLVERDDRDRGTVVFGDGVTGLRPTAGAAIRVTYRVGGGTRGRVRANRLTRGVGSFYTNGGTPMEFTVTNPSESTPGADRETIAHARVAAPLSLRATTRTIAREDYELHALEVPGVARALCHTRNEDPLIPWLQHTLYLIPTGGGIASPALCAAVQEYLTTAKPRGALDLLVCVPAVFKLYTVVVTLVVRAAKYSTSVQTAANAALVAFFDPVARTADFSRYTLNFGVPVWRSELVDLLQEIDGVEHVSITLPVDDTASIPPYASIAVNAFPVLDGTPSITVVVR